MKRAPFLLALLMLISMSSFAQRTVQSSVFDANNGEPLEMATIRLLNPTDSSLVQGAQTNERGYFSLSRVNAGKYILSVSMVGYKPHFEPITVERRDLIVKNIQLQENAELLQDLEVRGTAAQLVVRGDTLEYNAAAFKVQENAVVEELLKRLPGVEIASDGKITVNGQEIQRIRVDGKRFFDGDIEMVTKNLPADMIDKIQVLEQRSDMAQLTGFEDDDTERIINLTTRPNRRQGVFGNAGGGVGLDTENVLRYDLNGNVNIMKGNSQSSIVAGGNNVNTTRSARGRGGWGGNNGITTTQNFGLNNNTIINDNFKIGGNASLNHSNNYSETNTTKESYLRESIFNDSTYNTSTSDRWSANMRLEAEWKIDSLRTLIIQPNINYTYNTSDSFRDYIYLQDGDTTSYGNALNNNKSTTLSGGLRLIYNRRFAKPGRTLTTNFNAGLSQSGSEGFNYSTRVSANPTLINQYTNNSSDRYNVDLRVSFVEPLWNMKNMLETAVSLSSTYQTSVKDQYSTDQMDAYFSRNVDAYTLYMEEYSNDFTNRFFRETLELNYRYTEQNYNLTLGFRGEPSQTYSQTIYGDGTERNVTNEVVNFAPNGRFQYNFGRKEFLRFDYRGRTAQPSVNQMQPVKNNSNLMQETVGNPSLNPSFNNNFRLMYSTYNEKTFSSFSTWISGDFTKDALVTNRIYDSSGKQYNQTVNADQLPLSYNANVMFNTPIIQKRLHFNTSTNFGYNNSYGYTANKVDIDDIDIENMLLGDLSFTRRYSAQEQLSLTFTHDVVEIGLRGNLRYSNSLNNLSTNLTETYDWSGRGNVVLRLPYDVTVNTDLAYSNRLGYSNFDQSEWIWNASIDKNVFKNRGVLSVKWYDLLRQQLNIRQSIGDNSVSFSKYNTLTSYFLVSFSYRIRQFGGSSAESTRGNRPEGFGPGMRQGGGGGRMGMPMGDPSMDF